jgi:hypothetical protein
VSPESAAAGRSGADRLAREIAHGRKIGGNAETVWFWEGPTGRRRAERRAELFVEHCGLGPGKGALERVPLVREIAGSMPMRARRA